MVWVAYVVSDNMIELSTMYSYLNQLLHIPVMMYMSSFPPPIESLEAIPELVGIVVEFLGAGSLLSYLTVTIDFGFLVWNQRAMANLFPKISLSTCPFSLHLHLLLNLPLHPLHPRPLQNTINSTPQLRNSPTNLPPQQTRKPLKRLPLALEFLIIPLRQLGKFARVYVWIAPVFHVLHYFGREGYVEG
jgi:hypothetical protein